MKVSIIVPTYNHERFIEKCLTSILSQKTNFDFEVLIGEDNSTDKTREIIEKIIENYKGENEVKILTCKKPKIFVSGKMTGIRSILNMLENAKGEYIAFCEGDDYWINEDKLQKQVDYLESHNEKMGCVTQLYSIYDIDESTLKEIQLKRKTYPLKENILGTECKTCTIMYRNNIDLKDYYGYLENHIAMDWLLSVIYSKHGDIDVLEDRMAVYRLHSGGIWSGTEETIKTKSKIDTLLDINKITESEFNEIIDSEIIKLEKRLSFFKEYKVSIFSGILDKISSLYNLSDKSRALLGKYEKIYIYGQGSIGVELYKKLRLNNIDIETFVEKEKRDRSDVIEIKDIEDSRKNLVIVTVHYAFVEIKEDIEKENDKVNIVYVEEIL